MLHLFLILFAFWAHGTSGDSSSNEYRKYYRFFDLSASPTKLRRRFRQLALEFHPDKVAAGGTEAEKAAAKRKFLLLSTAFNKLLARSRNENPGEESRQARKSRQSAKEKGQEERRAKELRDYKEKVRLLQEQWIREAEDQTRYRDDAYEEEYYREEQRRKREFARREEAARHEEAMIRLKEQMQLEEQEMRRHREQVRRREALLRKLEEERLRENELVEYLFKLAVGVVTVMGALISYFCFALRGGKVEIQEQENAKAVLPAIVETASPSMEMPSGKVLRSFVSFSEEVVSPRKKIIPDERFEASEDVVVRKSPRLKRRAIRKVDQGEKN